MGEVLPFMELEGYKKLKEMEEANLRLHKRVDEMQRKLDTETVLRQLYQELAQKRMVTIMDLKERIEHGEAKTGGSKAKGGQRKADKTTPTNPETNWVE